MSIETRLSLLARIRDHSDGAAWRDFVAIYEPANVLIDEGGHRVLISDFGLARALDDASVTASGVIAGTPPFMSPEQARGETPDRRGDLFSLGSVIYAMATGRPPFRGESPLAVLRQITEQTPTPLCAVNERMPGWIGRYVETLMSKRAEDRPESAEQTAETLRACLNHVRNPTVHPLPDELLPPSTVRGWVAGNARRRWLTGGLVASMLVAGVATAAHRWIPTSHVPIPAELTVASEVGAPSGMTDAGLDATAPDRSATTTKSTVATDPPDAAEIDRQIDAIRSDLSRLRTEILEDLALQERSNAALNNRHPKRNRGIAGISSLSRRVIKPGQFVPAALAFPLPPPEPVSQPQSRNGTE